MEASIRFIFIMLALLAVLLVAAVVYHVVRMRRIERLKDSRFDYLYHPEKEGTL